MSRTSALEAMQNSKGRFFTVVFTTRGGATRTMNCQYLKDQGNSRLGYVKVREVCKIKTDECIRNVNLQTLSEYRSAGNTYKIG